MSVTFHAGDLNHEDIGKTVTVKVGDHITVEDELEAVGHLRGVNPDTLLVFKNVTPDTMDPTSLGALLSQLHPKRGFFLAHDTPVTVRDTETGDPE